jgi:hypothetical protein
MSMRPRGVVGPSLARGTDTRERRAPGLVERRISGRATVRVSVRDACVQRHLPLNGRPGGGRRRAVRGMSPAARRRLVAMLRNLPFEPVALVTLTYGSLWPGSAREVERQREAFAAWLRRRGIRAAWKLEFQRRGAPHITLWTDRAVPMVAAKAAWHGIAYPDPRRRPAAHADQGVQVTAWVGGRESAAIYAAGYAKKSGPKAYQDVVPFSFGDVYGFGKSTGRVWGRIGFKTPEDVYERVQPVTVRTIRRAYEAERRSWRSRRRRWRDTGRVGFRALNCAGVARALLKGQEPVGGRPSGGPACGRARAAPRVRYQRPHADHAGARGIQASDDGRRPRSP